ncbi:hypothetical protein [Nocardioides solisilvae]|uniref:hypothetical protein n=1 Tax=Nocardioides solisilvae TaxID=1542435 RepID=UPI000D7420E2|nr:hypothetical protein [Nocardioides solisilvae]
MTVLEKMLVPAGMQRIVEQGYDALSGPVYRADDLFRATPAERVAAHGLEGELFPFGPDPEHVDVVRFGTNPLMDLRIPGPPTAPGERPWPVHDKGFLRNAVAVWELTMTRVPTGARFVRVHRDGTESEYSRYGGAAWGWQNAKGYFPPLHLIGPRATWHGLDLPASYTEDQQGVELVWVGDRDVPDGFTPSRPRVHSRVVPVAECESVFEVVVTARWRDEPVRVLQQAGGEALVVLLDPTVESVNRLGATALEPTLFQATAPADELEETHGVVHEPRPREA